MLDWLKTILGEAYSEEIDKKVSEEIGKNFVARADFNTLNTEKKALADTVKERDKQLETLKASTGDVEALKTQIATLQTENTATTKAHEAEIKRLKIDNAVELALSAAKAKNVKAVKALLDLDKAELDTDGTVKGLADQITYMVKAGDLYKIQVGAFKVKANAEAALKKLQAAGFSAFLTTEEGMGKSVDELAREVLQGKWGNGAERKKRLEAAGYDYAAVQKKVNQLT